MPAQDLVLNSRAAVEQAVEFLLIAGQGCGVLAPRLGYHPGGTAGDAGHDQEFVQIRMAQVIEADDEAVMSPVKIVGSLLAVAVIRTQAGEIDRLYR